MIRYFTFAATLFYNIAHAQQGNLPTPVRKLAPYPPIVCVTPNWTPEPFAYMRTSVTVSNGEIYPVSSGQTDTGDIVFSGGTLDVLSGGTISNTVDGGTVNVSSGGASSTTILGGGFETISAGGFDTSALISVGGYQLIGAGGEATSTTVAG
jgi:autotransporter passenger strand-loop-strand repeat protein